MTAAANAVYIPLSTVAAAAAAATPAALDTGFCHLIGSISSDVIGWLYKIVQSSFGLGEIHSLFDTSDFHIISLFNLPFFLFSLSFHYST